MERREFLVGAAAVAGLATASKAWTAVSEQDKLARIAIMMFGMDRIVKYDAPPSPERTLEVMDFGEFCADRYKVHNIEVQSYYFPSTEMSYFRDFRARLNKTKTKLVQINLEYGTPDWNITAGRRSLQLQVIDIHRHWLENIVPFLGCPRVLVNQGQPTHENKQSAIEVLKAIVGIARSKKIIVSMENRGGGGGGARAAAPAAGAPGAPRGGRDAQTPPVPPAAPPQQAGPPSYLLLAEILKGAGATACCDLVNFPSQSEQQEGAKALIPITSGLLHAGGRFELPPVLSIIKEMGYKGLYSIKAMGMQGDPRENTQKIIDVVLANM